MSRGAHDIRPLAEMAKRGGVLTESDLLAVTGTLISARSLARAFEKQAKDFPKLAEVIKLLPPPPGVIESISRCISDRGEVLDSASPKLGAIRADIKVSHARLMSKLEHMISDSHTTPMLQEAIITQRNGRYVIPLRAEYRSKLKINCARPIFFRCHASLWNPLPWWNLTTAGTKCNY